MFHRVQTISQLVQEILAFQGGLCPWETVTIFNTFLLCKPAEVRHISQTVKNIIHNTRDCQAHQLHNLPGYSAPTRTQKAMYSNPKV